MLGMRFGRFDDETGGCAPSVRRRHQRCHGDVSRAAAIDYVERNRPDIRPRALHEYMSHHGCAAG